MMKTICILALLFVWFGQASAQVEEHAACAAPPPYIPADLLERPVPLRSGTGNAHESVSTSSKEAQAFYDQALNYLHGYVWIEASRSFHQALRNDPELAMAYLGLSYVQTGLENPDNAKKFLEKAKLYSSKLSDSEKRRIDIREKQLAALENLEDVSKHLAFKKSIDDALAKDLNNVQLWLLRGNAEEPSAAGRGQRGTAASVAFYQMALDIEPENGAAHHFLVHSYETIGKIDKALEHGEQWARIAPSIPHAAHMWGHDLRRVGRMDEAIEQFQKTDSLERAYYKAENIDPSFDWHHGHNLDLLSTCYEHKGQMNQAEKIIREAAGLLTMTAYDAFRNRELPSFLIRRGRYAEAVEAAQQLSRLNYPQSRTVSFALMGQAYIGLGKMKEAEQALEKAKRELENVPRVVFGVSPNRTMVQPWVDALQGELLLKTDNRVEGSKMLKDVQRVLRGLPGPDNWIQSLFRLESIARAAREAGDWELAEYTASQMLDHDSAYGGSHLAMALALQQKGDAAAATREFETAKKYWNQADAEVLKLTESISTQRH
ncbi:MAG TPA: tetratricopeptide repeat protein [Acidobacteriota bacterium]|nr:tetratricopeptide repeat protein [Acidobacteriota bacterium]